LLTSKRKVMMTTRTRIQYRAALRSRGRTSSTCCISTSGIVLLDGSDLSDYPISCGTSFW
jgi:hypothetical protein